MQVNVLRKIARMTKRGSDIRTDQIGSQCLDALGCDVAAVNDRETV